jgi:hypothetical protein
MPPELSPQACIAVADRLAGTLELAPSVRGADRRFTSSGGLSCEIGRRGSHSLGRHAVTGPGRRIHLAPRALHIGESQGAVFATDLGSVRREADGVIKGIRQDEERHGQRVGQLGVLGRPRSAGGHHDRLGQPVPT